LNSRLCDSPLSMSSCMSIYLTLESAAFIILPVCPVCSTNQSEPSCRSHARTTGDILMISGRVPRMMQILPIVSDPHNASMFAITYKTIRQYVRGRESQGILFPTRKNPGRVTSKAIMHPRPRRPLRRREITEKSPRTNAPQCPVSLPFSISFNINPVNTLKTPTIINSIDASVEPIAKPPLV